MWSFDEIRRDFRHVIKKMEITLFEKNIMTILFRYDVLQIQCENITLFFLQTQLKGLNGIIDINETFYLIKQKLLLCNQLCITKYSFKDDSYLILCISI